MADATLRIAPPRAAAARAALGRSVVLHVVIVLGALVMFFPFYWTLVTSLTPNSGLSSTPQLVPADASLVYARNLLTLLLLVWKDKKLGIPETDQEVMGTLLARDGALVHPAFNAAGAPAVSVAS